jgi:sialic acid synthase SpsE
MDPAELRFLIDRSKEIWIAANNPKQRSAPEEDVYRFARGSVVADRDLPAGPCDRRARHLGAAAGIGRDRGL